MVVNGSVVKWFEARRRGFSGRRRELLVDIAAILVCGGIDLISAVGLGEVGWTIGAAGLLSVRRRFPATVAVLLASVDFVAPGQLFATMFCALYTIGAHARVVPGSLAVVAASVTSAIPLWDDEPVSTAIVASELVLQTCCRSRSACTSAVPGRWRRCSGTRPSHGNATGSPARCTTCSATS